MRRVVEALAEMAPMENFAQIVAQIEEDS